MNATGAEILRLLEERDIPESYNVREARNYACVGLWGYPCGGKFADKVIARLRMFPGGADYAPTTEAGKREEHHQEHDHPTAPLPTPQIERRGMFSLNGEIYKVAENPRTGRLNAHRLDMDTRRYSYAKGALYRLTEADRLSVDTIAAHGLDQLWCLCCGRDLDRKDSQKRGIGPICAEKYGY